MTSQNKILFFLTYYQYDKLHVDINIKHAFTLIRFIAMVVKCQPLFLPTLYMPFLDPSAI